MFEEWVFESIVTIYRIITLWFFIKKIIPMVRNSVAFVSWQRKQVCADLKTIYSRATEWEAEFNLELFAQKWEQQYPSISKSWRSHWVNLIPFFAFPPEIRRVIYTTNAIESMNSSLRKVITSQ